MCYIYGELGATHGNSDNVYVSFFDNIVHVYRKISLQLIKLFNSQLKVFVCIRIVDTETISLNYGSAK